MGRFSRLGNDLYSGQKSIDFVGRRWLWYVASAVLVLVAIAALVVKGLDYGIEFTGGAEFRVTCRRPRSARTSPTTCARPSPGPASRARRRPSSPRPAPRRSSCRPSRSRATTARSSSTRSSRRPARRRTTSRRPSSARAGVPRIAQRSLIGLLVFLVLVVLFIWAYFREWKMSVAALVALAHDVVITVGIYALSGFEVTPATVTGVLTILGFSLYDTVVVFDKVRENTKAMRETRHELRRGSQPRRQPDPGALDQHLDRRPHPGRRDPVRRRGAARLRQPQGPRAGAVRRHGGRRLLVDLHRDAARGGHEVGRDGREAGGSAREGPSACAGRPVRRGPGPRHRQAGGQQARPGRR